jgi:hypothetical protein
MISGSVAAMFYGEPRVTHDIDLVVWLVVGDPPRLQQAFPSASFYVPPAEVITVELRREQRGHFNIIHIDTGLKADIYLSGHDELHAWAKTRTHTQTAADFPIILAPPEYVILRKLEYFREGGSDKHLRDIRSIISVSSSHLDRASLDDWARRLRLEPEWQQAQEGLELP